MTMTMTNVLFNINAYSDSVKYSLQQLMCKKNHVRSRVQIYARRL